MDLYEYQGKQLFAKYGIPVSQGDVAYTADEAEQAAKTIGGQTVVKAQVLIGGRGKAGGIKLANDPAEARMHAENILGMDIRGHEVRRLWIESASDIKTEWYLSITFDRAAKKPLVMFSTMGGVDIEQVAEEHPDKIARLHIDPLLGIKPYMLRQLCFDAGVEPQYMKQTSAIISQLYDAFLGEEAMLVEINPLIVTEDDEVKALDSKFSVDDSALFRHPEVEELRDIQAADPQEQMAREKGVTYVKLDGSVGILGNGAGLVMSTLDVVQQSGGTPANFLDVGGGAQADEIVQSLEVILSDDKVKSILFNIFGGITRCDEVAQGIITALSQLDVQVPIVVRLDGTAAEQGLKMLEDADLDGVEVESTMLSAAKRAIELATNSTPAAV